MIVDGCAPPIGKAMWLQFDFILLAHERDRIAACYTNRIIDQSAIRNNTS